LSTPNPATNALSYNLFVQQIGIMAVVQTQEISGVWQFVDAAMQGALPSMLNYAELRIGRDLNLTSSMTSNTYALTPGAQVFSVPVNDFLNIQTAEIIQTSNGATVNAATLLPVSKEFIQNCYGGLSSAGTPQYFAMIGSNFGTEQDTTMNILFGPPPNFGYTLRLTGIQRQPSLFQNAVSGIADTEFTQISQWYPDMLVIAAMIYVSAFQRNWSAIADDSPMAQSYEKQYQALRLGAIPEADRQRQQGSGWSAYGTPTSATPTR
jgi:hypothetical protein